MRLRKRPKFSRNRKLLRRRDARKRKSGRNTGASSLSSCEGWKEEQKAKAEKERSEREEQRARAEQERVEREKRRERRAEERQAGMVDPVGSAMVSPVSAPGASSKLMYPQLYRILAPENAEVEPLADIELNEEESEDEASAAPIDGEVKEQVYEQLLEEYRAEVRGVLRRDPEVFAGLKDAELARIKAATLAGISPEEREAIRKKAYKELRAEVEGKEKEALTQHEVAALKASVRRKVKRGELILVTADEADTIRTTLLEEMKTQERTRIRRDERKRAKASGRPLLNENERKRVQVAAWKEMKADYQKKLERQLAAERSRLERSLALRNWVIYFANFIPFVNVTAWDIPTEVETRVYRVVSK